MSDVGDSSTWAPSDTLTIPEACLAYAGDCYSGCSTCDAFDYNACSACSDGSVPVDHDDDGYGYCPPPLPAVTKTAPVQATAP